MIHQEPNWSRHLRLYRDRMNGGSVTVSVVPYADTFKRADLWFDELREMWRVTVFDAEGRIVGNDDQYETKAEALDTVSAYFGAGRLSMCQVFAADDHLEETLRAGL